MIFVRRLLKIAGVLLLAASVFFLAITPDTLRGNEHFKEGDLRNVIGFVEETRQSAGRIPTEAEFEGWKATQGWENRAIFLQTAGPMKSEDCPFGEVPAGSYGITMWRGDWNECYAEWERSYSFDGALGTNLRAAAIFAGLAMLAFGVAAWLVRQTPNNSPQARRP
jgi:hypothetical protein